MAEVVLLAQAERDLEQLLSVIASENPGAADRMAARLARKLDTLSAFPDIGSPRPELGRGVRILVEGNYLIIYEGLGDRVEIVRVVHGARDLPDLL